MLPITMEKMKILLLEDDEVDADLIIRTLERADIPVSVQVTSGSDGFRKLISQYDFDAILADNSLPQFNATYALEVVNELNIKIPFILVTGSISEEYAVEIMKLGAWDYILKDRLQRLPNALLSAVNKHQLLTERQKFLNEVIRNEALMREAEQLAHFGSWEADLIAGTNRWSDEYYRILGYQPGAIAPTVECFRQHVHRDDKERIDNYIKTAISGTAVPKFHCRIITQANQIKHLKCEIAIKYDTSGNPVRINGIICDVTETVLAQEELMRSEANLHTIFDNTETGYALLDSHFRILQVNEPMLEFSRTMLSGSFTEGSLILDYYPKEIKHIIHGSLMEALSGNTVRYELPYPQPDESNRWYDESFHPVNKNSKNFGVIFSQTEITSRKTMEIQEKMITNDLIQRKNELEQFTYIISHNLRSPVANILGITNLLKESDTNGLENGYLLDGLCMSVKKLDDIIVDLNEIIRVKRTVGDIKEIIPFGNLVDDIIYSIGNVINNKNIDFLCKFNEKSIFSVKSYMHSIFFNLISNSIKYRRPNVPLLIEIYTQRVDDDVEIRFKDNGVGIDLVKKKDQVFGLYKRFHTDLAEGKGMGLFMVKTHVEALGGKLSIASEVNRGTEFLISFPYAEAMNH